MHTNLLEIPPCEREEGKREGDTHAAFCISDTNSPITNFEPKKLVADNLDLQKPHTKKEVR